MPDLLIGEASRDNVCSRQFEARREKRRTAILVNGAGLLFVMAVAIDSAAAVRSASRDDAPIGPSRTAGPRCNTAVQTISVPIAFTRGTYDAVTGAFAVRKAVPWVAGRPATG